MDQETDYLLQPTIFHSMREAQEPANKLEQNLATQHPEAASISGVAVETFSKLLNNAAEHGMNYAGAHCHVRLMPHRLGNCLDIVVADSGPGIRATLAHNPNLPATQSDQEAITLAIQKLTSGTGMPTRGIGLWITVAEMCRPGRKLEIHSGTGLLTMYGAAEPEMTETAHRPGTLVRANIPFWGPAQHQPERARHSAKAPTRCSADQSVAQKLERQHSVADS